VRRRLAIALAGLLVLLAACASAPDPSVLADECSSELPARTSPVDYPVAILHVAGDDLAPVVGEVEWLGAGEPVATTAPRPVHLERFTVLQTQGHSHASLRMTDDVAIETWRIDALPLAAFRAGDLETGRVRWIEGDGPTEVICVPISDGEWAIVGDLTFADDAGSATFYWRLNVIEAPSG